ncbi:condensin subunit ScpA [Desulfuromusa kysingii]|uniref:Segregation and condensation protein A n=1 Tax=Desulfuromusa kysingii TaxID=37625 RepID=A0A1H4CZH7_9BACT|nr:segregation/condensation protein A [Desulfuromusa kysingii]SEA65728.1 condensin subunit ScpA [Desulfuromusa kysingii]
MAIEIQLENFSGPLDLLLHLIKSHEMDIYDIRIVEITEQYLSVIEQMQYLDLDVAGEFLLMAASLIHIKSRMLLPVSDEVGEEEEDPRAELVKRLLEYQRYKDAAEVFQELPQLNRDIFTGQFHSSDVLIDESEEDDVVVGLYQLAEAFYQLLKEKPPEVFHEVIRESLSVADYIERIAEKLLEYKRLSFREIFSKKHTRSELIVTFIATLEMVKMHVLNIEQVEDFSEIWLVLVVSPEQLSKLTPQKDLLSYG